MTIQLHNTLTRRKEVFSPIDPANVRMYVCGPTVYDRAHLGNARPAIVFDVLFRLLRLTYGEDNVTYVRNFTDVDDKINARAARDNKPISDITEETIAWYLDDMAAVGVGLPTYMPRATEYIAQMRDMIADLIAKGHAYTAQGHALFAVDSYADYGGLSGRSVEDMIAGARVEVAPYKRNPMDFVLWKPAEDHEPGWDSPWGRGRPGWHIECSAMARDLLGDAFDIHGGGNDLMFPHHENEIAQSRCAHPECGFANIWMHNEMLQVEGKKMSKSLGNFFTVRDLLDTGVPGEVIRFVMLMTHYRKPMDWTASKASDAQSTLRKWHSLDRPGLPAGQPRADIVKALSNDLNTSLVLTFLTQWADTLRKRSHDMVEAQEVADFFASARLIGLLDDTTSMGAWVAASAVGDLSYDADLNILGDRLRDLRIEAMQSKNFAAVDDLKAELIAAGIEVRMSKAGVDLMPADGFDPVKLKGLM